MKQESSVVVSEMEDYVERELRKAITESDSSIIDRLLTSKGVEVVSESKKNKQKAAMVKDICEQLGLKFDKGEQDDSTTLNGDEAVSEEESNAEIMIAVRKVVSNLVIQENGNKRKIEQVQTNQTESKKPKLQTDNTHVEVKNQATPNKRPLNDYIVRGLTYSESASSALMDYLNQNEIVYEKTKVKRSINPKSSVSLYFNAMYNSKPVFVKISCYKFYFENRQLMQYLKSQDTSHYLNKVFDFKVSEHEQQEICAIFELDAEVVEYIRLNGRVFLSVIEPVTELREVLLEFQPKFYPLKSEDECKFTLTLIVKLFCDYLKGIKELHNMGIIHCDVNFLNCQLVKTETKDEFCELVDFPFPFIGVLIDFNSSRLESQPLFSKEYHPLCTHQPSDHDDLFDHGIIPNISFTKSHDIYALSFVVTQLTMFLLNFTYLKCHFRFINCLLDTKNPSKDWLPKQWDLFVEKAPTLFHNSQPLIDILSQLKALLCTMFKNPSSFADTNYFEVELHSIRTLLLNYLKKAAEKK